MKKLWKIVGLVVGLGLVAILGIVAHNIYQRIQREKVLEQIVGRLSADSRVAQVLVTEVRTDPATNKPLTTIKFVENDACGRPLPPKYFTFANNTIQFQSLVIRFDDFYIKKGDPLRGKSAYLFMKAFTLNGDKPEVFEITRPNEIPSGYEVEGAKNELERDLWRRFWEYALDPAQARAVGVKNAQIEAPGTRFVPGLLYTLKIEHDGGLRIDAEKLPEILRGEKI